MRKEKITKKIFFNSRMIHFQYKQTPVKIIKRKEDELTTKNILSTNS